MRDITDEELHDASTAELEDLEFRIHTELQERERNTLDSLFDGDEEDRDFDDAPF